MRITVKSSSIENNTKDVKSNTINYALLNWLSCCMLWWFIVYERLLHFNVPFLPCWNMQSSMSQCNDIVEHSSTSSICNVEDVWCLIAVHRIRHNSRICSFSFRSFVFSLCQKKVHKCVYHFQNTDLDQRRKKNANHCFGNIQLQSNHTTLTT